IRPQVRQVWQEKRQQLEQEAGEMHALLTTLNLPLHQDPNARAKPVDLKPRQVRTVLPPPTARAKPEPQLNRDDVHTLVDFIEGYARQFEVSPQVFAQFEEEQLRDLILGMMNANYPGSSTGETFNKLGKADIT